MRLFRRQPVPVTPASDGSDPVGELIPPRQHRCKPPKCHEWPAGEWKVDANLEMSTAWICPECNERWVVTIGRGGLWKVWEEARYT